MSSEVTKVRFDGQHVYVGIDVARRSWKVCIVVGQEYHKRFSTSPDPRALVQHLQKNFSGAIYHTVYEAGYFGFWIHRALTKQGVHSMVINPADVPTTDKERHTKTDRVDAAKLARSLASGSLGAIYIPDRVAEEDRSLLRMRASFVKKQTRTKCQIKAMLRYYGEQMPDDITDRYWTRAYIGWLESRMFEHETGRVAFQTLVQELLQLRSTIAELTKRIHALSMTERYRKRVELLLTVPGIRLVSAMTFLTEIVTLERFKDRDRLLSYVGLVPGEHSTGDTEADTGLIHRRNGALRYILIECAWVAQHEDPALLKAFTEYSSRMPKSMAIVHIARKLVTRMRYVLKHEEPYVTGVLSNGYIQAA